MDALALYEEIVRLQKAGQPAALATVIATNGSTPRKTGAKILVRGDGTILGTIGGGKTEAETITAALRSMRSGQPETLTYSLTEHQGHVCGGDVTIFLEPLHTAPHAILIGAGHVGRAVAKVATTAGFQVTLIDTAGHRSNHTAGEDIIIRCPVSELASTFEEINVQSNCYIFIATSEHTEDFVAADAALTTKANSISVLGSTRKRAAMENYLQKKGYSPKEIKRIISPAGLELQAETPGEIAVSVVAQMIQQQRAAR